MKIMMNKPNEREITSPINSSMEISPREECNKIDYPVAEWIMKSNYSQNIKLSNSMVASPTELGPDIEADLN